MKTHSRGYSGIPGEGTIRMFWQQLAGNLTQGLVLGAVHGVATMGLSLIFGVLRVVEPWKGSIVYERKHITFS